MVSPKNKRWVETAAALLLTLGTAGIEGCGGCRSAPSADAGMTVGEKWAAALRKEDEEEKAIIEKAHRAEAESRQRNPPPPPPNAPAPVAVQSKPRNEDEKAVSPQPKKPIRPKEIADWKRDDYYSAQRDDDPQLVAAVGYLGEHFAGKESAAELLAKLLESSASSVKSVASADPDDEGGVRGTNPRLVESIVAALDANRTPSARRTLERLVMAMANSPLKKGTGSEPTSENPAKNDGREVPVPLIYENRALALVALKALCSRSCPENEDLLFRVIAAPEHRESAAGRANEPEKLRATALGLAKSSASEALRLRLAKWLVAPDTPQKPYEQIWSCLNEPRTENMAAQIVLYQSDRLDEKAKELLERQFTTYSRTLLARLLGVPASKELSPTPETASATTDPYRMAGLLWGTDLTTAVEQRLRAVDGLEQGARLVLLASTMPTQPMRTALLRALEKHWEEGTKGLLASAAVETPTQKPGCEPGFLLLLKRLPRRDGASSPGYGRTSRTDSPQGPSAKTAKAAADRESRQRQEQAAQQWMTFSEGLLRANIQRFYAAALAQRSAGKHSEPDSGPSDLPLKLPPNADIVASYRMDWPQRLDGNLVGVSLSPLRVRYIRIEQKAKPLTLLSYYRRQLPSCEEHVLQNAVWLDNFSIDKEQAGERSVDVLITRPNKGIPMTLGQEQELIVEILVIECEMTAPKRLVSAGK